MCYNSSTSTFSKELKMPYIERLVGILLIAAILFLLAVDNVCA